MKRSRSDLALSNLDLPREIQGADVVVLEGIAGQAIQMLEDDFDVTHAESVDVVASSEKVRALIIRNRTLVDAKLLHKFPCLEIIGRAGVGLETIDLAAAEEAGVVVTYAPDANTASTAEHTVALALALAHRIVELDSSTHQGAWTRLFGSELAGGTWGVVGFGRIGRRVAAFAAALDMRVLATDPAIHQSEAALAGAHLVSLRELLSESDVVSLHVPLSTKTRHIIGHEELMAMRRDAMLINTARGQLVDEAALRTALLDGRFAGVGLDVREMEPPPRPDPLAGFRRVVLTPHVGGLTEEAQSRVLSDIATDVRAVLQGGSALRSATVPRPIPRSC